MLESFGRTELLLAEGARLPSLVFFWAVLFANTWRRELREVK
jgi:hypothetical protein